MKRDWLPGGGLILLVASAILAVAFFAWGARRPPLDSVQESLLELRVGKNLPLGPRAFARIQRALCRYPGLGRSLLDEADAGLLSAHQGHLAETRYAYYLRGARVADRAVQVELVHRQGGERRQVRARTLRGELVGEASASAPFRWAAPPEPGCDTLLELAFDGPGVRIKLEVPR